MAVSSSFTLSFCRRAFFHYPFAIATNSLRTVATYQRACKTHFSSFFSSKTKGLPFSELYRCSCIKHFHSSSNNNDITTSNVLHRRCLVTEKAPNFTAQAAMPEGHCEEVSLYSILEKKKYVCLFFYPLNFTFVCPTEIIAFNEAIKEFESRNVQLLGVSVDSHFSHVAWKNMEPKNGGIGKISFPLISDLTKSISKDYGVLLNNSISLRGLFLIDINGIIRHQVINDLPLGRSVDEAIRVVDALQHTEKYGEVCPANWSKGKDAMRPSAVGVSDYFQNIKK